jgi:hypothetical protein
MTCLFGSLFPNGCIGTATGIPLADLDISQHLTFVRYVFHIGLLHGSLE